jgi:pimeloyl-ACP methyl ester carboxylesterase
VRKRIFFVFLFFAVLVYGSYIFIPPIYTRYQNTKIFNQLNLKVEKLKYDNDKDYFEYIEGGKGSTIVFVHGFQSTKRFWLPYIKRFINNYDVIAMDLPGHGNSSRPKNQKYDLQSLADSLALFIEKKNLNNFHLVGTSMGGGIAAIYAYKNPEKIRSLILINPLGIVQEEKSDLQRLMEKGKNIFFPKSLEEFDEMTVYISGKPLTINSYFKKYFLGQMVKDYSFFRKVFNELVTKSKPLDDILPQITTPTLILIGQKDRIIHPASYECFVDLIPNAKPVRLINGNHVLIDAYFDQAVRSMNKFLKDN